MIVQFELPRLRKIRRHEFGQGTVEGTNIVRLCPEGFARRVNACVDVGVPLGRDAVNNVRRRLLFAVRRLAADVLLESMQGEQPELQY